jgi:ATP/maltotriose-dependent transcriptional regulator MalT
VWIPAVRVWRGDLSGFERAAQDVLEDAARLRSVFMTAFANWYDVMRDQLAGRLDAAESKLVRLHRGRGLYPSTTTAVNAPLFALTHLRWERGRARELEPLVRNAIPIVGAAYFPPLVGMHAALLAELGQTSEALDAVGELMAERTRMTDSPWWPLHGLYLADAVTALENRDLANDLYQALVPFSGRMACATVPILCLGAIDRYLARLAILLGHHDNATRRLDAAMNLHQDWSSPPLIALTRCDQARLALARGDNPAAIRPILDRVVNDADAIGMIRLANEARALRER